MESPDAPILSVVLNVMGRLELADYGFRSWMVQDIAEPYEVVLNLFNEERARYEALAEGRNPHCRLSIQTFDRPAFFNISGANNLGLHASRGTYVAFVNSDVVYPTNCARRIAKEMVQRNAYYAQATRRNLSAKQTRALPPVAEYTADRNLDALRELEFEEQAWFGVHGWIIRREICTAIGGFDATVLVAEDSDLCDRAMHYLRRQGLQDAVLGLIDVVGYHLYHPTSELSAVMAPTLARLRERGARMEADPLGEADIVPTRLDSRESLIEDVRQTPKPPPLAKYRKNTLRKVAGRFRRACDVLIGRR